VFYFFFILEWRSKPGKETSERVVLIRKERTVKKGDEDDGIVSRRKMRR
jgi:hypothetical protein